MAPTEALLDTTMRLIKESRLNYRQIAEGSAVDREWLAKLCQGAIRDPGVRKIQRVHDFLRRFQSIRAPREEAAA